VGGQQLAPAAQLVHLLQELDVGARRLDASRRDPGLQVDGPLATRLRLGDHRPVPVALVAELPVELVDEVGQARRGRPGHGTRGGQPDADQLQLAEQGVVVLLERQVGLDRDADEADGAEPRAGVRDAVGRHAGLLLRRRGGRGGARR
jgi:hypothetical protein